MFENVENIDKYSIYNSDLPMIFARTVRCTFTLAKVDKIKITNAVFNWENWNKLCFSAVKQQTKMDCFHILIWCSTNK